MLLLAEAYREEALQRRTGEPGIGEESAPGRDEKASAQLAHVLVECVLRLGRQIVTLQVAEYDRVVAGELPDAEPHESTGARHLETRLAQQRLECRVLRSEQHARR